MEAFTDDEMDRLSVLKDARERGLWPAPVPQSFAERHGITMTAEAESTTAYNCTVYRCALQRDRAPARMVVRFQVTAHCPEPPLADEVLRWLAMSCAHVLHTKTLEHWGSFHFLTGNTDSDRYPYRGLVRPRTSRASFADALRMDMNRFFAFLGRQTYDALLVSIDAAG